MGSAHFQAYERTLRRMFMLNLVENLEARQGGNFRASLVVNARTGLPVMPKPGEFSTRRRPAASSPVDQDAA